MDLHVLWTSLQLEKLKIFLISPQLGIKTWKGGRKDEKTSSIQKRHGLLRAADCQCTLETYSAWVPHVLQPGTCVLPSLTPTCAKEAQRCKNREQTATLVPSIAKAEKIPVILAFNFPRVWTLSERRSWERVRTMLCEMCGKFKKQSLKKKKRRCSLSGHFTERTKISSFLKNVT